MVLLLPELSCGTQARRNCELLPCQFAEEAIKFKIESFMVRIKGQVQPART